MSDPIIHAQSLSKSFQEATLNVSVLQDVDFQVGAQEMVAIIGASGSGKSTLLQCIGGLEIPTSGKVLINGQDISCLSEKKRGQLRNQCLGFVYQFHHLLPEFDALDNVAMPLFIRGVAEKKAYTLAGDMLEQVGLGNRRQHKPGELSGGERQRAAIARALVTRPQCVLADEPTGNLDSKTAESIYHLLFELNQEHQTSFIIVTHDKTLQARMQRTLTIQDGCLREVQP